MGNLVGLPGVKGGKIENVPFARSVTGAMKALKKSRAVTGAGSYGAWTVWQADDSEYRCDFSRYMVTKSKASYTTKAKVYQWLKTWLPQAETRPT